jgi:hypothetical protein
MTARSSNEAPVSCLYRDWSIDPDAIILLFEGFGYHRAPRPAHIPYRPGLQHITRLVRDEHNFVLVSHHNTAVAVVGYHAHRVLNNSQFIAGVGEA